MQLTLRDAETFGGGDCMKTRGGIQLEAFTQILRLRTWLTYCVHVVLLYSSTLQHILMTNIVLCSPLLLFESFSY